MPDEESPRQDSPPLFRPAPRSDTVKSAISSVPSLSRRRPRTNTVRTFTTVQGAPFRPSWQPGQEPGLDVTKPDGGRPDKPVVQRECQISIVDYSEQQIAIQQFGNADFIEAFERAPEKPWACRWISVNGLSWDVISCLGRVKKLHRLSIEDLLNVHSRAKADWYADHTYVVLTLQKLVQMSGSDDDDDDDDNDYDEDAKNPRPFSRLWTLGLKSRSEPTASLHESHSPVIVQPRTIQRYRGGPNEEKLDFMESHSSLKSRNLAAVAEQVSIFLTADNTIITIFEASAEDIEKPIFQRLGTRDTVLRRSADASMLLQAVLDAIVDLAIPVVNSMQDVVGSLELDVLTRPSIGNANSLYIATSEIAIMRSIISPILGLVKALQDHGRRGVDQVNARPESAVAITPLSRMYLEDVSDHIIVITESLDQVSCLGEKCE